MKRAFESFPLVINTLLLLTPLFYFPIVQDYYDTGKQYALVGLAIFALLYVALKNLKKSSHFHITLNLSSYAFMGLLIVSLISLIRSENRIEALLHPLGAVTFFSIFVLLAVLPTLLSDHNREKLRWVLFSMTTLLSIISIYQFFGLGSFMATRAAYLTDSLWTPTGYSMSTIGILLVSLPLFISQILESLKKKHESSIAIAIVMTSTVIVGLGIILFQFIPKIFTAVLPLSEGWAIALETLKNPSHMFTGVGADNFLQAFSAGRSSEYNVSPIWNIRFTTSASLLLHVVTVFGLLGLGAMAMVLKSLFVKTNDIYSSLSLWTLGLLFIFTQPSVSLLSFYVLLILLVHHDHGKQSVISLPQKTIVRVSLSIVLFAMCAGLLFFSYRTVAAELSFYRSLQLAKENNGTGSYNQQVQAIQMNRFISKYHIFYSQTNLALASSLTTAINQPDNSQTPEQKTKDQQLVAQLIQQSIREAKIATTLNKSNVLAWENLARIYNQLAGVAQGAEEWSESSYKQAMILDPKNPILQLESGTIAIKRELFDQAINYFQKSIALKPNYANAHYNLSHAHMANGDQTSAVSELKKTLQLLPSDSEDYAKVIRELKEIETIQAPDNPDPTPTPSP